MGKNDKVDQKTDTKNEGNFITRGIDAVRDNPVAAAIGAGAMGILGLIGLGIKALVGGGDDDDGPSDSKTGE